MSGMIGANPQDLNDFARQLDQGARILEQSRTQLAGRFQNVRWNGPDAANAKAAFNASQGPSLSVAAAMLKDTANKIRNNAQEQLSTSAESSLASGAGASGGPSIVAVSPPGSGSGGGSDGGSGGPNPWPNLAAQTVLGTQGTDPKLTGSLKVDADGNATVGTEFTNSLGTEQKTSFDHVPFLGKVGAEAGIKVESSYKMEASSSADGDTYTVTSKISTEASAGVDAKKFGIDGSYANGDELIYELKVPHGVNPAGIDPNNPASWPPGTQIQVTGSKTADGSLNIKYNSVSLDDSIGSKDGTTRIVTSNPDGTVTVQEGPTKSLNHGLKLGVGDDDLKVSFNVDKSLSQSELKSVTFDPNSTQGASALDKVNSGGSLPTSDAPGLKDITRITTTDFSTSNSVEGNAFGNSVEAVGAEDKQSQVATYKGDGSSEVVYTRTSPGAVDFTKTMSVDSHGTLDQAATKYDFTVSNISDMDRQILTSPEITGINGSGINNGDDVKISLTQAQMDSFYQEAKSRYDVTGSSTGATFDIASTAGPEHFPTTVQTMSNNGNNGLITNLFFFAKGNGEGDLYKFPGTVEAVKK